MSPRRMAIRKNPGRSVVSCGPDFGLLFVDDILQHVDKVSERMQADVALQNFVFQVDGKRFKAGTKFRIDI